MSYTPNTWSAGDIITAQKLNAIEQGIANAGGGNILVVNLSGNIQIGGVNEVQYHDTLDTTFADIYNALAAGTLVYIRRVIPCESFSDYNYGAGLYTVLGAYKYNNAYRVYALNNHPWYNSSKDFLGQPAIATFYANSPTDYPTLEVNTISQDVVDALD